MEKAIKNGQFDLSEFKPQLKELFKIKDERIEKLRREIEAMINIVAIESLCIPLAVSKVQTNYKYHPNFNLISYKIFEKQEHVKSGCFPDLQNE